MLESAAELDRNQTLAAFREAGFLPGAGARRRPSEAPSAYGLHSSYSEISARGEEMVLGGAVGSFALMAAPESVTVETDRELLCVLRPEIEDAAEFWPRLGRAARQLDRAFVVKSVDCSVANAAAGTGLARLYRDGEGWSAVARYDDQTFPEVVLDLTRPGAAADCDPAVTFERLEPQQAYTAAREVVRMWLEWYLDRHAEYARDEIVSYYDFALSRPVLDRMDDHFVACMGSRPVAFAASSRIAGDQADLWVCLTTADSPCLSRAFLGHIRRELSAEGVRYLGLGGSELRSLFHFKRRLGGKTLLHRTHLLVGC